MRLNSYRYMIGIITLVLLTSCQNNDVSDSAAITSPTEYDSTRAATLGADEYGMSQYVIAFLYKGPNQDIDPVTVADYERTHMSNIKRLTNEGKLLIAGPFTDNGDLRGIYILNVKTIEEAKALTNTDPSIQRGILRMELHPWYGTAAIKELNDIHSVISKIKM